MGMGGKIRWFAVSAVILAAVAAGFVFFGGASKESVQDAPAAKEKAFGTKQKRQRPRKADSAMRKKARPGTPAVARQEKPKIEIDSDEMPPEERKLLESIEKALDDDDLASARALAAKALNSKNEEIRQAMVDTLGWFGEKTIAELTPFLADPSEDVRDSAVSEWTMAVAGIENDDEKISVIELAMNAIDNDDILEDVSGEYIGLNERKAVESLLRVMEAGGTARGIAKAKETYEFVTGEEFTNRADAEKWMAENDEDN